MREPAAADAPYAGEVPADARVQEVAGAVTLAGRPFAVVDGGGVIVGALDPETVVAVLAGTWEHGGR